MIVNTTHLVKSEDLNHHNTLFAGRVAEWFVESGFLAAAKLTAPENIVCKKIHGMEFNKPANLGDILSFESIVAYAGRTSLITYVEILKNEEVYVKGFLTFIHVDENGKPIPHGISLAPRTDKTKELYFEAEKLKKI